MQKFQKIGIILVFHCLGCINAQGYDPYFNYASLSYGFYSKGFEEFVNYTRSKEFTGRFYNLYNSQASIKGPLSFKCEFNVAKNLGLMPYIGYEQIHLGVQDCTKTNINKFDFTLKSLSVAVRSNYHFYIKKKWFDPFIGVGFGVTVFGFKRTINDKQASNLYDPSIPGAYTERRFYLKSPVFFSATCGFRLYFSPRLGFNVEVGWEKSSLLHLGLVYRLKG